jgi:hypothetical protein
VNLRQLAKTSTYVPYLKKKLDSFAASWDDSQQRELEHAIQRIKKKHSKPHYKKRNFREQKYVFETKSKFVCFLDLFNRTFGLFFARGN